MRNWNPFFLAQFGDIHSHNISQVSFQFLGKVPLVTKMSAIQLREIGKQRRTEKSGREDLADDHWGSHC